jgi:putative ABC transport system permease protein
MIIMLRNYFRIAFRHLLRDKTHSLINIAGLAVGMAVALLIAGWIYNECSYEKYNPDYDRIARIRVTYSVNGQVNPSSSTPLPLADELRSRYGSAFTRLSRSWWIQERVLNYDGKQLKQKGNFMEPDGPGILGLTMLKGSMNTLSDASSIILSASAAKALFGNTDPIGKTITIDTKMAASVRGIYKDLPDNSQFTDLRFIGSWELFRNTHGFVRQAQNNWGYDIEEIYVQLAPHVNITQLSAQLRNSIMDHLGNNNDAAGYHPQVALDPMRRWHLYSSFATDTNAQGLIQFVWLFATIGAFVLLLACINFINLSTARSERRSKEVGIRKTIGSGRGRLIIQFFSESLLMSLLAFLVAIVLVLLARPLFDQLAGKNIDIQWSNPWLWLTAIGFCLLTALLAGSYPAIYLSSFRPVSVLNNTYKAGRQAATFRRTLVVLQFTIGVVLVIGTIVVFRQISYAKDRPVGFNREGLLSVLLKNPADIKKLPALREELLRTGAVVEATTSSAAATEDGDFYAGYTWPEKAPNIVGEFNTVGVSPGYGKTIGWTLTQGRDFSNDFGTDSFAVLINEAAVKFMGLRNPLGEKIGYWNGHRYTVIGIVKNILTGSPYDPPVQSVYMPLANDNPDYIWLLIRMKPGRSVAAALNQIGTAFKAVLPGTLFDYQFVDEEFGRKFAAEQRIGGLAATFALLALFISGLGIFGMASFMAERRTKEIGIRKVLGATILQIWQLLSKEFVVLVGLSFLVAMPAAFYLMHQWLQRYPYHSGIPWWIFAATAVAVLCITLLTVSAQAIKAALTNPVSSLRRE